MHDDYWHLSQDSFSRPSHNILANVHSLKYALYYQQKDLAKAKTNRTTMALEGLNCYALLILGAAHFFLTKLQHQLYQGGTEKFQHNFRITNLGPISVFVLLKLQRLWF